MVTKEGRGSKKTRKESKDLVDPNKKKFDYKTLILPACLFVGGLALVGLAWWIKRLVVKKKSKDRFAIVRDFSPGVDPGESIFVSVPAYRETEVASTVTDIFAKARCPFRVYVGVCSQIDPSKDPSFWSEYESVAKEENPHLGALKDNVRVYEIDYREAKGPAYARAIIDCELYRGEKYYMTVDAHTKMAQDWDVLAISCLEACPSKKPVLTCTAGESDESGDVRLLSMYHFGSLTGKLIPEKINRRDLPEEIVKNEIVKQGGMVAVGTEPQDKPFPKNCLPSFSRFAKFDKDTGAAVLEGSTFATRPNKPVPALFWSANFSFSYGKDRVKEVPFDPEFEHIFFGEEIAFSARLYTHGYDLYHPTGMLTYQRWQRDKRRGLYWELFDVRKFGDAFVEERLREKFDGQRRLNTLFDKPSFVEEEYDEYPEIETKRRGKPKIYGIDDDETEEESQKSQDKEEDQKIVRRKIQKKLPASKLGQYGLGSERTLSDYQAYCGLDLRKNHATARAFCGVTREPERSEVLSKYGGMSAYQRRMRDYQTKRKWRPRKK